MVYGVGWVRPGLVEQCGGGCHGKAAKWSRLHDGVRTGAVEHDGQLFGQEAGRDDAAVIATKAPIHARLRLGPRQALWWPHRSVAQDLKGLVDQLGEILGAVAALPVIDCDVGRCKAASGESIISD